MHEFKPIQRMEDTPTDYCCGILQPDDTLMPLRLLTDEEDYLRMVYAASRLVMGMSQIGLPAFWRIVAGLPSTSFSVVRGIEAVQMLQRIGNA